MPTVVFAQDVPSGSQVSITVPPGAGFTAHATAEGRGGVIKKWDSIQLVGNTVSFQANGAGRHEVIVDVAFRSSDPTRVVVTVTTPTESKPGSVEGTTGGNDRINFFFMVR